MISPRLVQGPEILDLCWTQGDQVNLQVVIEDGVTWAGTYTLTVSNPLLDTMVVTVGAQDITDALMTVTMTEVDSLLVPKGEYLYRLRQDSLALTRFTGRVLVS